MGVGTVGIRSFTNPPKNDTNPTLGEVKPNCSSAIYTILIAEVFENAVAPMNVTDEGTMMETRFVLPRVPESAKAPSVIDVHPNSNLTCLGLPAVSHISLVKAELYPGERTDDIVVLK